MEERAAPPTVFLAMLTPTSFFPLPPNRQDPSYSGRGNLRQGRQVPGSAEVSNTNMYIYSIMCNVCIYSIVCVLSIEVWNGSSEY